jgi:outer membrane protein TolC
MKDAAARSSLEQLDHGDEALPPRLKVDDVVMLALRNNPDLVAVRAQRGIAQAQLLEAGIAPNPILSGAYGFLLGGPGTIASLTGGVSQDVKALFMISYKKKAAEQAASAVDATVLWQEWQVIAKARQLSTDLIEGEQRRRVLDAGAKRLTDLVSRSRDALKRGDTTLTSLIPDLGAEAAANQLLADFDRRRATSRRDLNRLLGLTQEPVLPLADSIDLPVVDSDAVSQALQTLPDRRPDLVALQFGYGSQEARVRGAILGQFPLLALGVSGGHDNSDVRYVGPQMSVELPVFNRNQGTIAIERATRQQLHDEFTARLLAARTEIASLMADQHLLQEQIAVKRTQQAALDEAASKAIAAHQSGDLDERTYLDAVTARDGHTLDTLAIGQILLQQQIAIATLIGAGMPPITIPPKDSHT